MHIFILSIRIYPFSSQDIHPFYADLCNVLYDRDHYKLALGQVNTVRGIVDHVAKDYVRLLKYADSPYKCKMLKRAALGRMCTAVRKLGDSLKYLEEVRQHLSRLPSINPNTRTLILTGYPNVGKSSFINSVSHANVDVQPYAFTTKSLFVGHFDYSYSRWQVIDTPGILDHPLANRNTIELTAITALAHIQAAVMFFVDISEQCGFPIESQVALFHSIKVLFKNKPLVIVLNKVDIVKFADLPEEKQALLKSMTEDLADVIVLEASCLTSVGIDDAKNKACEMLLTRRVEAKIASKRADAISNRLHVTAVTPPSTRPACIPASVKLHRKEEDNDEEMTLSRDLEEGNGGAGVYSIDMNSNWQLRKEEWKYDIMPEFYAGKNVLDFIDPDIENKLKQLEQEEARLLQEDASMQIDDAEWQGVSKVLSDLHKKIEMKRIEGRLKSNLAKRTVPRRGGTTSVSEAQETLASTGYDVEDGLHPSIRHRGPLVTKTTQFSDSETSESDIDSDDDMAGGQKRKRGDSLTSSSVPQKSIHKKIRRMSLSRTGTFGEHSFADAVKRARESTPNRLTHALPSESMRDKVEKIRRKKNRELLQTVCPFSSQLAFNLCFTSIFVSEKGG